MSIYIFKHIDDNGVVITVEVNDSDAANADADKVIGAFVQFLKGVTFSSATVSKYIDHELA